MRDAKELVAENLMQLKAKPMKWDRNRIRYVLGCRGLTIKALAAESQISAASLRMAFCRPSLRVNSFIAQKLNVPLNELWPDWFDADGDLIPAKYRRKLSRQRMPLASHESTTAQGRT